MLTGIKFACRPTAAQKKILSQWMGCARFIWNGKCDEERYHRSYARNYCPVGTFAPVDKTYSQFKTDLTPWLKECPSQILRNSARNWYLSYERFIKGSAGRPRPKRKGGTGSVHLTRELFRLERCEHGTLRLFIGSTRNNIGYLPVTFHRPFKEPNSIYIRREAGRYFVSFCYDDDIDESVLPSPAEHLAALRQCTQPELESAVIGIDRGVARPIQAGENVYRLTDGQAKNKQTHEQYVKRLQRRLSRQQKGSNRYHRTRNRLASRHRKIAHIRHDFCHQVSRQLVDSEAKVFVFEDLKTRNMTRSAKGSLEAPGKRVRQKSGLNRAILNIGWYQFEQFTAYKAHRASKVVFKISPHFTSQECAACGHIHPDNRRSQDRFLCVNCGHADNADHNAVMVIKQRAIRFINDSGTELSSRGVLRPPGPSTQDVESASWFGPTGRTAKRQKRRDCSALTEAV